MSYFNYRDRRSPSCYYASPDRQRRDRERPDDSDRSEGSDRVDHRDTGLHLSQSSADYPLVPLWYHSGTPLAPPRTLLLPLRCSSAPWIPTILISCKLPRRYHSPDLQYQTDYRARYRWKKRDAVIGLLVIPRDRQMFRYGESARDIKRD